MRPLRRRQVERVEAAARHPGAQGGESSRARSGARGTSSANAVGDARGGAGAPGRAIPVRAVRAVALQRMRAQRRARGLGRARGTSSAAAAGDARGDAGRGGAGGDWRGAGVGSAMACAGQVDGGAQRLSRARREKER